MSFDDIFLLAEWLTRIMFVVVISLMVLKFLLVANRVASEMRPARPGVDRKRPRYQVVTWRHWIGVCFKHQDPAHTNMAQIYDWYLYLGFVEIRKWKRR